MIRCMKCDSILEIKNLPSGKYMEPCPKCLESATKKYGYHDVEEFYKDVERVDIDDIDSDDDFGKDDD